MPMTMGVDAEKHLGQVFDRIGSSSALPSKMIIDLLRPHTLSPMSLSLMTLQSLISDLTLFIRVIRKFKKKLFILKFTFAHYLLYVYNMVLRQN